MDLLKRERRDEGQHIPHKWFLEREIKSSTKKKEEVLESRLRIYDRHLSHKNYATICYCHEKNVTKLKLPLLTIKVFQSLGVAVFKSLKEKWGNALYTRLIKTRTLSKSGLYTVLSSDEVWRSSFTIERIQMGFKGKTVY